MNLKYVTAAAALAVAMLGFAAPPVSAQNAENDKSVEARLSSFYEGLEADNSKTYWTEHKAVFDEHGLDVSPDGKYIVLTDFLDHAMRVYERVR